MKRLAAVLVSVLSFAFTANGYRSLTKRPYGSVFAFAYGLFASELPMQSLGIQFAALAAVSRRLPPRIRRFSWLLSAMSWLGLLGLRYFGRGRLTPTAAPGGRWCARQTLRVVRHQFHLGEPYFHHGGNNFGRRQIAEAVTDYTQLDSGDF